MAPAGRIFTQKCPNFARYNFVRVYTGRKFARYNSVCAFTGQNFAQKRELGTDNRG